MLQTTVDRPLRVYKSKLKAPRPRRRRRNPVVPTILLFGLALFLIAQVFIRG